MLSQALYWSIITTEPRRWFHKTAYEWEKETYLTLSEQQSARKTLRYFSFWREERRGLPAKIYYRVDLEKLRKALMLFAAKPQTRIGKPTNQNQAKHANKNGEKSHSSSSECRKPYKEAETTTENTRLIPPTPLGKGGERSHSTAAKKDADLLQRFNLQLKHGMLNDSFQSKNLDADDYDRYFRDTWFAEIRDSVIFADGTNRTLTAEGLRKYKRRLKTIGKDVFGREVEFQMVTDW